MTEDLMRAADFLDTLGVNTHIPYTDGGYANIANVEADLQYLGISQVRDQITNGANSSAPLSSYIALAQSGVKFTIGLIAGPNMTTADLQSQLALAAQLNTAVPGSVIAVEGANEINNFPISYNGVGGLQGAVNLQQDLYAAVQANPALQGVSVDYFTGYDAGSVGVGPNPATTAGLANYDTQHPYPNFGQAPAAYLAPAQALPNETPATGPAVYTETGYGTNGGTTGSVNADVQAKYTLDLLMDAAKDGIAHTDLYQLLDAYQPGSPQGDDGYGLFDPNNQPKEAATAIRDLTTILADPGAGAGSFTPIALNDTITGLPGTGNSIELQKSSGATDIVVWAEPAIWNVATGTEIAAPVTPVNVALGGTYNTVEVFDPLLSSAPQQTLFNVSSVSLEVTDHPLIVEVEPQTVNASIPCFLRGTSILTPSGEIAVEDLRSGQLVSTLTGVSKPVRWIGWGRTRITSFNRDRCRPIVVRRDALGVGVPSRDLYLTRGHSLFLDGCLIAVEHLINHRSIAWVDTADSVEYYHIELDDHDVLLAENAPAESYREDANSLQFKNGSERADRGLISPYAPIVEAGPELLAIWRQLSDRAGVPHLVTTDDPDLHLLADGKRVDPLSASDHVWRYRLAGPVRELRIASRSTIPAAIGFHQDQRRLGVALRRIVLSTAGTRLEVGWDADLSVGFNNPEPAERHRWTTGDAVLPESLLGPFGSGADVELHVGAVLPYQIALQAEVNQPVRR